jgi:hypothetical protein
MAGRYAGAGSVDQLSTGPPRQTGGMCKAKRKRTPKTVLRLPDLEQSKSAVLNSLASQGSQRSYDHAIREFIECYCSEPWWAFNKTVVTRYHIFLEQAHYASSTINLRLAAVAALHTKPPMPVCSVRTSAPEFDGSKVPRSLASGWAIG